MNRLRIKAAAYFRLVALMIERLLPSKLSSRRAVNNVRRVYVAYEA